MISEKLLSLVGETEKLDELKAIMDEMDATEAKVTEQASEIELLRNHVTELNDVNAKLLLSSVNVTEPEKKNEEPNIEEMSEEEFFDYLGKKVKEG